MTGLDPWHRFVAGCLRGAYFGRVRVTGEPLPRQGDRPRLILASHRNGAIDGVVVQRAFPSAQYLVSLQLLRNPLLRVFFTGIPVVRPRDAERYGMDPRLIADPVAAGVRQLAEGGDLAVFPEGTSEWGHAPGDYRRGAARIWCALREQGVEAEVVPVGLFYGAPDRFRSIAELRVGRPVALPTRAGLGDGAVGAPGDDVRAVHDAMAAALDAVSVRCPDASAFDAVQSAALRRARRGASFADAFLDEQGRAPAPPGAGADHGADAPQRGGDPAPWPRRIGFALMWLLAPVLLAAHAVGRRADARNTVTFFRMLGGSLAAALWLPVLVVAAYFWPWPVLAGAVSAAAGWLLLGARRWHPEPDPIARC